MLSKEELKRKCIVCGQSVHQRSHCGYIVRHRGTGSLTCSHACSKIYMKIYARIFNSLVYRMKRKRTKKK